MKLDLEPGLQRLGISCAVLPRELTDMITSANAIRVALANGWYQRYDAGGIAVLRRLDDVNAEASIPTNEAFVDFHECMARAVGIVVARASNPDRVLSEMLPGYGPIHGWFELSYAQYLTIPRSVLQSMPAEWQHRFAACLEQLDEAVDWRPDEGRYWVRLKDKDGRFVRDPLMDYERGRRRVALRNAGESA